MGPPVSNLAQEAKKKKQRAGTQEPLKNRKREEDNPETSEAQPGEVGWEGITRVPLKSGKGKTQKGPQKGAKTEPKVDQNGTKNTSKIRARKKCGKRAAKWAKKGAQGAHNHFQQS